MRGTGILEYTMKTFLTPEIGRAMQKPTREQIAETRPDLERVVDHQPQHAASYPPPSPQLPDFKPRSMSPLDKTLWWIALFAVLIFCMIVAAHYFLRPINTVVVPKTTFTCSPSTHVPKGSLLCKQ
jgi:hypothetical protein